MFAGISACKCIQCSTTMIQYLLIPVFQLSKFTNYKFN